MSTQINRAVVTMRLADVARLAGKFDFDLEEAKRFLGLEEAQKKAEKKEKKEEKPKRAHTKSGYQLYSNSIRAEATLELKSGLEEGEKMARGATQKKCGEMWKALDEADREEWVEKAKTPDASDDDCELEDN